VAISRGNDDADASKAAEREEELKEVRERILEKLERMRERELPEQLCSRCGEAMKAEAESPAMAVAD
jgi:hypothetical protein